MVAGINQIQYQELQRLQTNSSSSNSLYQAENGTIFNGNGYAVSASGETCTDGKDDGKLTFMEGLKNFGKGLISPITSMFKSPKNFLVGALTIAAGAGLCFITGGAAAPFLVAAGATMGAVQVGTGLYKAATATTDAEAKDAWQGVGTGTFAVAASVAGAKSAAKAGGIQGAENMNAFQATKACFKAAPSSLKNSVTIIGSKIGGFVSSKIPHKSTKLANTADNTAAAADNTAAAADNTTTATDNTTTASEKPSVVETKETSTAASDKAMIEEAKARNIENQNKPALTRENANSPQAETYKQADEIKLTDAERAARGKANVENFSNKYQTKSALEQQLQYQQNRLAKLQAKGGNKGGIKAIKDQIKVIQQQLDDISAAEMPKTQPAAQVAEQAVTTSAQSATPKTQPAAQVAEQAVTTSAESATPKTSNPFKLTGKQSQTLNNLSKTTQSQVADWLTANEYQSQTNLFKAVEAMYTKRFGTTPAPVKATVTTQPTVTPAATSSKPIVRLSQIEKFNLKWNKYNSANSAA